MIDAFPDLTTSTTRSINVGVFSEMFSSEVFETVLHGNLNQALHIHTGLSDLSSGVQVTSGGGGEEVGNAS